MWVRMILKQRFVFFKFIKRSFGLEVIGIADLYEFIFCKSLILMFDIFQISLKYVPDLLFLRPAREDLK